MSQPVDGRGAAPPPRPFASPARGPFASPARTRRAEVTGMKWRPDASARATQPGVPWERGRPARLLQGAGETPAVPGQGRIRRMMQSLLYGRGVDRARKAQARLGLALFGFVLVYAIIACRLALYAATADTHMVRRGGATHAVATARPDILDRNGEIHATDLKTPSLFAEPRRIIDPDEA